MATDLSPAEKDDRESERLLNRKPPPSRKHRERRAPRHWQRRRRIREDDPDMRSSQTSKPSKLIDWTKTPDLRADRGAPKSDSEERWESRTDDEIRRLDKMLKGLDSFTDADDDVDSSDFDAAIKALSDGRDVPPAELKRLDEMAERVSEADPDHLADLLRGSVQGYESVKGSPDSGGDGSLPEVADRLEDDGYDHLAELLRGSAPGYESLKGAPHAAASYGTALDVAARTGAYHGVKDVRGNPTDPTNTGWHYLDQRYIDEKDYDAIVKFAGKLLKEEDWLKYGWEGGATDAPVRAALDLAIQTANGCSYQSKIDVDTYNLLLNKLGKLGYDTFSDTVLSVKAPPAGNRSASIMDRKSKEYQNIVRVASDLRQTDPGAAMEILKNLRALVSTDAAPAQTISEHVAGDVSASGAVPAAPAVSAVASAPPAAQPAAKVAASPAQVEVPFGVLARLAASSPEAKQALGPYILAAGKKKMPPEMLEQMKKGPPKGKAKGKKGKKKKAAIASSDATW